MAYSEIEITPELRKIIDRANKRLLYVSKTKLDTWKSYREYFEQKAIAESYGIKIEFEEFQEWYTGPGRKVH